ncbi:MAG: FtsX-like permease family protein [Phycisphaerae bacterium]
MISLALKLFRGHMRRHALEVALCLVGIALGVAVVVGIDLAVAACVSSFASAVDALADRATHSIVSPNGAITDQQYIDLARQDLPTPLAPIIDRHLLAAGPSQQPQEVHLLGADPFSEQKLRSHTKITTALSEDAFDRFLTQPNEVVLVAPLAKRLGVTTGDSLTLTINSHHIDVHIAGVVTLPPPAGAQLADLMFADISTAQELFGGIGRIDRIDVLVSSAADEAILRRHLPADLQLVSTDDRSKSLATLTAAYRMNLNALSLMASFVAIFIVYNALLVSVQQRATSLAILRSLGSSRLQLASIYLVEAVLFSLVGAALGIGGGWLIAREMVGYIATTINDLYAQVRPGPVSLEWPVALKGLGIAFGSGLLGALVPLWQASRVAPVSVMRPTDAAASARSTARFTFAVGVGLLVMTAALPLLPTKSPVVGFVMAITAGVGFAFLCPLITRLLCAGLDCVAGWRQSLPIRMAAAGVSRSLGITGVAVGAMMLALAMSIGIQTMVANFRGALDSWMDQRFRYDLFLAPQLAVDYKINAVLEPTVIDWTRRQPNVASIVTTRFHDAQLRGQSVQILGTQVGAILKDGTLSLKRRLAGDFNPASEVLISEPLAGKLGLNPGAELTLETPDGPLRMKVYAIFYDFRSERGQVMLDADLYARAFHDPTVSTLHVKLRDNSDVEATAARWAAELGPTHAVTVQSFAGLKTTVMSVFDRTFKVTDVLAWLAGGIAFCGLAGALVALSLARAREYAILTSLGLSRPQTAMWLLAEGLLIALTAAAVAIVAGTLLAWILASVIQYRSFGWSIPTALRPRFWLSTAGLAGGAALLASIYPFHMLKKSPPAYALRQE